MVVLIKCIFDLVVIISALICSVLSVIPHLRVFQVV